MIFAIISALASLGTGLIKGFSDAKTARAQISATQIQAQEQVNERARQARKLLSEQKSSFLKSGVFFEGSPQAVFDETYDFAQRDISAIGRDSYNQQKQLRRQGMTAFATSIGTSIAAASLAMVNSGIGGNKTPNPTPKPKPTPAPNPKPTPTPKPKGIFKPV